MHQLILSRILPDQKVTWVSLGVIQGVTTIVEAVWQGGHDMIRRRCCWIQRCMTTIWFLHLYMERLPAAPFFSLDKQPLDSEEGQNCWHQKKDRQALVKVSLLATHTVESFWLSYLQWHKLLFLIQRFAVWALFPDLNDNAAISFGIFTLRHVKLLQMIIRTTIEGFDHSYGNSEGSPWSGTAHRIHRSDVSFLIQCLGLLGSFENAYEDSNISPDHVALWRLNRLYKAQQ